MAIQVKQRSTFEAFNVSVRGDTMTMRIEADTLWNYKGLYELLQAQVENGVCSVLIDKRHHVTQIGTQDDRAVRIALCMYIVRNNIRLAAVLNDTDHLEKIACYKIMREGGQVLSTSRIEEAVLWLGGSLK